MHTKQVTIVLPTVEAKDYNAIINGKDFLDQPRENDLEAHNFIRKFATGQRDDSTTGSFLEYNCFKNCYKMIAIDLSKQRVLDSDLKSIQQINFN